MRTRLFRRVCAIVAVAMVAMLVAPLGAVAEEKGKIADVDDGTVMPQAFYDPDAFESDDSTGTATPIPNASYHTIDSAGDVDWFTYTVPESGLCYTIENVILSGDQWFDIQMTVYFEEDDGTLTQVWYEDDQDFFPVYSGGMMASAFDPGTYFLKVEAYDEEPYIGEYMLYFERGAGRRVAGANRFATAAEVSKLVFSGANNPAFDSGEAYPNFLVVANGLDYPDALVGSLLAAAGRGPLLLTRPDSLPEETAGEIERLFQRPWWVGADTTVFVLGGTEAVSDEVVEDILRITQVNQVERIGGADRYETASLILDKIDDLRAVRRTGFVVSGENWPDAFVTAGVAASARGPILLCGKSDLPDEMAAKVAQFGLTRLVVIGGTNAIDDTAYAECAALVGGNITRVAGQNRYFTAELLAEWAVEEGYLLDENVIVVSGESFADGLAAGPMVAEWNSDPRYGMFAPVLLSGPNELHESVVYYLDNWIDWASADTPNYMLGGPSVLPESVLGEMQGYYDPFVGWGTVGS